MNLLHINWNPDPEIFNLFGLSIRYYGVLFISGIIISMYILTWVFKKENLPIKNLEILSLYGILGIIIGARLGHCLFYQPGYYLRHPLEIILPFTYSSHSGFNFTGYQGLASHGGALGLIIAIVLYSKKTKHSVLDTVNLIAIVTGLSAGFIRLANFMNSEIIGIPTSKPWAIVFKQIDDIPRHPAQVYEAVCYFIIFIITLFLYKNNRKKYRYGFLFGLNIFLIFIARFFIEFVKENQVDFEDGLFMSMGQILSIPFVLVGAFFMYYGSKKSNAFI